MHPLSAHSPTQSSRYVGRFAPSPTGPLHLGSLLAALASYLDAKSHQGQWLVRIEGLDPPREVAGASKQILTALETYGLCWDGEVIYQSQRAKIYENAIEQLIEQGTAYRCDCSRLQVQHRGSDHYDDHCRNRQAEVTSLAAIRIKTDDRLIEYDDLFQGRQQSRLHQQSGDFVIRRKDGLFAYQLAVVVDDFEQGITHIVRGSDLLDSTPRQLYLQQLLALSAPCYGHIPVVVNAEGQKLSKQTYAPALNLETVESTLCLALSFLGLHPDSHIQQSNSNDILLWATQNWQRTLIPQVMSMTEEAGH